jgi:hypothetical protein
MTRTPNRLSARVWLVGLAAAAAFLAASPLAAERAAAATLHVKHARVTVRVPSLGHRGATRRTLGLPRGLKGYYVYMQLVRSDGKVSQPIARGRTVIIGHHGRKPVLIVELTSRYDSKRGRLRYGVIVRNGDYRLRKGKPSQLFVLVTAGYRA